MPRGPGPGRGWWCSEEGPDAVVGGTRAESAPPTWGAHLTCQPLPTATPGGFLAHGRPCPARPPLSSLIRTQLSPRSLSQRHFWKHRCQRRPRRLRALQDHCHSPWNAGRLQRSPLKARLAGRPTWHPSSSLFPWLCGCQSDARQIPNGAEGTASLGKCTVCPAHAIPSSS